MKNEIITGLNFGAFFPQGEGGDQRMRGLLILKL